MAVGYGSSVNVSGLNSSLGLAAVNLRDGCQDALQLFEIVNSLGVSGLVALGFGSAPNPANPGGVSDAQAFFNAANYLQTVAQVYYGSAAQTPAFNFDTALASARGGQ